MATVDPSYDPTEISDRQRMAGRKGGLTTSMRHDPATYTAPGLAAANSLTRFLDQVDPDHTLPERERIRRAEAAKKLWHMEIGRRGGRAGRSGKSRPK